MYCVTNRGIRVASATKKPNTLVSSQTQFRDSVSVHVCCFLEILLIPDGFIKKGLFFTALFICFFNEFSGLVIFELFYGTSTFNKECSLKNNL